MKVQSLETLFLGSLLLTLNVRSLYMNILHNEGIVACRGLLNARTVQQPPTEDVIYYMYFRKKNNFLSNKEYYLQVKGTTSASTGINGEVLIFFVFVRVLFDA